jgi:hypothetical protein
MGARSIPVTVDIVDEAGNVIPTESHCGDVAPNLACDVVASSIPRAAAFACRATTPESVPALRGNLTVFSSAGFLLRTEALR